MTSDPSPVRFHVIYRYDFVVTDEPGFYVVSDSTLDDARRASEFGTAEDFGDLRRLGDLEELAERLTQLDDRLTLEGYVEAIGKAGGVTPSGPDLATRLGSLANVHFDGASSSEGDYPPDWEDFRAEYERINEWEDPGAQIIAQATRDDLPARFRERFCVSTVDMFGMDSDVFVPSSLIDELVTALRQEGFDVVTDD